MLDKWAGYTWSWLGQFYPVVLWVLTPEWLFSCENPQYSMNFMPMEKFWNVALETGILCTQTKEKSPKCSSPCCQSVKVLAMVWFVTSSFLFHLFLLKVWICIAALLYFFLRVLTGAHFLIVKQTNRLSQNHLKYWNHWK